MNYFSRFRRSIMAVLMRGGRLGFGVDIISSLSIALIGSACVLSKSAFNSCCYYCSVLISRRSDLDSLFCS